MGCMTVRAIRVNHSIPDAVAYAIETPAGVVIQTGDFKVDFTPVTDEMIDLASFTEYGKRGVLALLADSTNSERPGFSRSERSVGRVYEPLCAGGGQADHHRDLCLEPAADPADYRHGDQV